MVNSEKFKIINGTLPWCDRSEWLWPRIDNHRLDRCFREAPTDTIDAMEIILANTKSQRTCVQAGGAMGVWPVGLASIFDHVYTFEAHPDNYTCLEQNTQGIENITKINAALGNSRERLQMVLPPGEERNPGAYYTQPGDSVAQWRIDDLNLQECDLIYLDIEGGETDALYGAADTIARCRPLIGVEDKKAPFHQRYGHMQSAVHMLINEFKYQSIARCHLDVILGPLPTSEAAHP